MPPLATALLAAALLALAGPSVAAAENAAPRYARRRGLDDRRAGPDDRHGGGDDLPRGHVQLHRPTDRGGGFTRRRRAGHAAGAGPRLRPRRDRRRARGRLSRRADPGRRLDHRLQRGARAGGRQHRPGVPRAGVPAGAGVGAQGVRALALSGSTLYVGGDFTHAGASVRTALAAVDAIDGHLLPFAPVITQSLDPPASTHSRSTAPCSTRAASSTTPVAARGRTSRCSTGRASSCPASAAPSPTAPSKRSPSKARISTWAGSSASSAPPRARTCAATRSSAISPIRTGCRRPTAACGRSPRRLRRSTSPAYFTHAGQGAVAAREGVAAVAIGDASATALDPAPSGTLNGVSTPHVSSLLVSGRGLRRRVVHDARRATAHRPRGRRPRDRCGDRVGSERGR